MKKESLILIAVTLCFVFMVLGIFVGRSMANLSVYTEKQEPTTQANPEEALQSGKIDINKATLEDLMLLPGIQEGLAASIIEYRQENGEFKRIEDIKKVYGIGEKRFDAISDLITVGG